MKNLKKLLGTFAVLCVGTASLLAVSCGKDKNVCYSFQTEGTTISDVSIKKGDTYVLPVPTRMGYQFDGWYLTADYSGESVESVVASSNATYYAKWTQLYKITLELDGGSLSVASEGLYLKEGANIYEYMQSYIPEKQERVFGTWLNGTRELSKGAKMTTEGITLTAKYKVGYTVQIYKESLTESGKYEHIEAEDVKGYEYTGSYSPEYSEEGFKEVSNANTVNTLVLSETRTDNIFSLYFDRETYTITYNPNYPNGKAFGDSQSIQVKFGQEVEVPAEGYTATGYYLLGWSLSTSGTATEDGFYAADYISTVLYNKAESDVIENAKFKPIRNMVLYGVWQKGYADMFGGNDYLYLTENSQVIYLSRADRFFKGQYNANKNLFYFTNTNDEEVASGKLNSDGTFVYTDETRMNSSCSLYTMADGLNSSVNINFDEYNGITYTDNGKSSKGTYTYNAGGQYTISFTEGELAGTEKSIQLVVATINNVSTSVFIVRNEEEYNLGLLSRFGINGSEIGTYNAYQIQLDGYLYAYYYTNASSAKAYRYSLKDGVLTLIDYSDSTPTVFLTAKLMEVSGKKGYMAYLSTTDLTATDAQGGTLTTDGIGNLTYTSADGSQTLSGYYTASSSAIGKMIFTMQKSSSEIYKFLIKAGEEEGTYTFETKLASYAEYYYYAAKRYAAPLLVVNDTTEGHATIYGYTSENQYVVVSEGTFSLVNGHFVYVATQTFEVDVNQKATPVDMTEIKSFVFDTAALSSSSASYSVSYWYSSTDNDDQTTSYEEDYTASDDSGISLKFVSGMVIMSSGSNTYLGSYTTSNTTGVITVSVSGKSYYFELNADTKTFIQLETPPYSAYVLLQNRTYSANEYITFNGKGGAVYTIISDKDTNSYTGTYAKSGRKTDFGTEIYTFTSQELTFDYLYLNTSSTVFITRYNDTYHGEYGTNSYLVLDGFGYQAKYITEDGVRYDGYYYMHTEADQTVDSDGIVYFFTMDQNGNIEKYFYIDVKNTVDHKTLTVRGAEYGTYFVMDNQSLSLYVKLDGYGNMIVFKSGEDGDGNYQRVDIDKNGKYTVDGNVYTAEYHSGAQLITMKAKLGTMQYDSKIYNTFVIMHKEVMQTYVNKKDWSILILDEAGNAWKYDGNGVTEKGTYLLISENLLYYVNSDESDACIYVYDVDAGTATPVKFTSRGYKTQSLDSLYFSQYGYANIGSERYYYNVVNGSALIYHQDPQNENANAYGFVEETFGSLTDIKEYNGKTYYAISGYSTTFTRSENTQEAYPVLVAENTKSPLGNLIFALPGSETFTTTGTVSIEGGTETSYSCTITRTITNGVVSTYVSVGAYIFDVEFSYTGEDEQGNTTSYYEVVGMRFVRTLYSAIYWQTYYQYWYIDAVAGTSYLASYKNTIGVIQFTDVYDEAGEMSSHTLVGAFGVDSGLSDSLGNAISEVNSVADYNNGLYTVQITAKDGYIYNLHVYYQSIKLGYLGSMYAYIVDGFTRVEELTNEEGYKVEVERVIASDLYTAGMYYKIALYKDGTAIEADDIIIDKDTLYYIVRTTDEETKKITATKYYKIVFTEKEASEEIVSKIIPYASVSVSLETVEIVFDADQKNFAEIGNQKVYMISYDGKMYVVQENVAYDETTKTYTVLAMVKNASSKDVQKKFTIKIENGVSIITEVEETNSTTQE